MTTFETSGDPYDEIARLTRINAKLIAAAKHVIAQADKDTNRLDDGTPNRTDECWESYNLLQAAITAAETAP
jgi:hypothetical protein